MASISKYVVYGVKAENESLFMNRIAVLAERFGFMEQLAEGVAMSAKIADSAKCSEKIGHAYPDERNVEVTGCSIERDNTIRIKYTYLKPCYVKTPEDVLKKKDGYCVDTNNEKTAEYSFFCEYKVKSSVSVYLADAYDYGVEVEIL